MKDFFQGDTDFLVMTEKEALESIERLIKARPRITSNQILQAIGISPERTGKAISKLVDQGKIIGTGFHNNQMQWVQLKLF